MNKNTTLPANIDEVLMALDEIIEAELLTNSPIALFAYVYRRTTAEIKKGVESKLFKDNERMQAFDVVFANYYIKAYRDHQLQLPISQSWKLAFDAAKEPLCIVQHITLGMNAHINLDLGIAASTMMHGKELNDLKADFMKVNSILFSLTDELQAGLGKVSKMLFLANWLGQRNDELLINFSIAKARDFSWITANRVWSAPNPEKQQLAMKEIDKAVALIGNTLRFPKGWLLKSAIRFIRRFEETDMRKVVDQLKKTHRK